MPLFAFFQLISGSIWPHEKVLFGHIINLLLTKLVLSRWVYIGLVLFCVFIDLDFVSVRKNAKIKVGLYPAKLTSRLVKASYPLCPEKGSKRPLNVMHSEPFALQWCFLTKRPLNRGKSENISFGAEKRWPRLLNAGDLLIQFSLL